MSLPECAFFAEGWGWMLFKKNVETHRMIYTPGGIKEERKLDRVLKSQFAWAITICSPSSPEDCVVFPMNMF